MQLSENQKYFTAFLLRFWNLHWILNILKKTEPPSLSISEVIDSEICAYLNA